MEEFEKNLQDKMRIVNEKMGQLVIGNNDSMNTMLNYLLEEKGKQLRPKLLLISASYCNHDIDATEFAAIIELVHMATLVHDDVIDNASIRRGRLSIQKKFGIKSAVYLGDYMIFSILNNSTIQFQECYKNLLGSMNKLCDGELGQNDKLYDINISVENYMKNIEGKTASMFEAAAKTGALICNAQQDTIEQMEKFGRYFGILFQINDDLMDIVGNRSAVNKAIYQDFENGIYTLPVIYALKDKNVRKEILEIRESVKHTGMTYNIAKKLTSAISKAGGFEKTLEFTEGYYQDGIRIIKQLRECPETRCLSNMFTDVIKNVKNYCLNNQI